MWQVSRVQVEEHFLEGVLTKLLKQGFAQAQLFCDVDLPLRCETTVGLLQEACHDLPGTESVIFYSKCRQNKKKKCTIQAISSIQKCLCVGLIIAQLRIYRNPTSSYIESYYMNHAVFIKFKRLYLNDFHDCLNWVATTFKLQTSGLSYRHIQGVAVTWPIGVSQIRCPQKKNIPIHTIPWLPEISFQWPQTRTCQTSCLVVNAANLLMRQSHTCLCPVQARHKKTW